MVIYVTKHDKEFAKWNHKTESAFGLFEVGKIDASVLLQVVQEYNPAWNYER